MAQLTSCLSIIFIVCYGVVLVFTISLLSYSPYTFSGGMGVQHKASEGVVDGNYRLFSFTFLRVSERQFALRVTFSRNIFAVQARQWVSNIPELGG